MVLYFFNKVWWQNVSQNNYQTKWVAEFELFFVFLIKSLLMSIFEPDNLPFLETHTTGSTRWTFRRWPLTPYTSLRSMTNSQNRICSNISYFVYPTNVESKKFFVWFFLVTREPKFFTIISDFVKKFYFYAWIMPSLKRLGIKLNNNGKCKFCKNFWRNVTWRKLKTPRPSRENVIRQN